jgi:hypothetical protein
MEDEWLTIERPGYLGKKRDEVQIGWTEKYGPGNWKIAYQWGGMIVPREMGIQLYEDGYYEFLKGNPSTLEWLIGTASEIYDTEPTNVQAGLSYYVQETQNNHIHDVAIRRAVLRLGKQFHGDHLVHVRSTDSEGAILSPGFIPFHMPDMILKEEIKDYSGKGTWWNPLTIEDFYQKNKVLLVKTSPIPYRAEVAQPNPAENKPGASDEDGSEYEGTVWPHDLRMG